MDDIIHIRASSKRNGLTTAIAGIVSLVLSSLLMAVLPTDLRLGSIFLISASLVTLLIGWLKIREPAFSLTISKQNITYQHRFGRWTVSWQNIQRIDVPTIEVTLQRKQLDLVGIKLKHYPPLLSSISPRLANNLLLEQRPLLLQNKPEVLEENVSNYGANLLEDDRYSTEEGEQFTGIQAMFANRMAKLRERLGYDLYLQESELDRPATEFVALLRQCQAHALQVRSDN